jgi:hypothetical protein
MIYKYTEKESLQYADSGSPLIDFYKNAPILRDFTLENKSDIVHEFIKAYTENPLLAIKLLFWLRDPRSGQGEKASGRKLLTYLYNLDSTHKFIADNLDKIVEYGSYKDISFIFKNTKMTDKITLFMSDKIKSSDRLACKWAPRLDSKDDAFAVSIRNNLGMTNKEYRKWIKDNSETVEQSMSQNAWNDIEYTKIPSIAMKRYGKAFAKHDADRFDVFKNDKTQKVNVSVLYPHEIVNHLRIDEKLAEKFWENLPNYVKEGEIILPIIDVSGSMIGNKVMHIAISLGLYLAERMHGQFKNKFMTFDSNPRLMDVSKLNGLKNKLEFIEKSPWGGGTDFEAAYKLLLDSAKMFNIAKKDMPTMIVCFSDMQFDEAMSYGQGNLQLDSMRKMFAQYGYDLPKLVFWDLRGKKEQNRGSHAQYDTKGVALVAGFSTTILKAVLACDDIPDFTPYEIMLQSINYVEFDSDTTTLPLTINYVEKIDKAIKFDDVKINRLNYFDR